METTDKKPLLVVLGPTASGKTALAVQLANKFDGEIISADSRQVYKGLDIGTGKDLESYILGDKVIKHHLIDHFNAGDKYNVHFFKEDFYKAYTDINSRNKLPIVCGGTGLYIQQILQHYPYTTIPVNDALRLELQSKNKEDLIGLLNKSDDLIASIDLTSVKRIIRAIEIQNYLKTNELPKSPFINFDYYVIGLHGERSLLRNRIKDRLLYRMNNGLIEEAVSLQQQNISTEIMEYYGLEYKYLALYLNKKLTKEEMFDRLFIRICQYAKRQETYFRKMEKDGIKIHWINFEMPSSDKESIAENWVNDYFYK